MSSTCALCVEAEEQKRMRTDEAVVKAEEI